MPQINPNKPEKFNIRRTSLNVVSAETEGSPLGKKLMKIASEIENSNEAAFGEVDIEQELEKRRGGYVKNGQ